MKHCKDHEIRGVHIILKWTASPAFSGSLSFPRAPSFVLPGWLAFHFIPGGQGEFVLILYFGDEDTETERGEGDLVKVKPKRGCPRDEGVRALPLLAV